VTIRTLRTKHYDLPHFRAGQRVIPQAEIQRIDFNELRHEDLGKGKLHSFMKRFLPRFKISFPYFSKFLNDVEVTNYFKRIYPYSFFEKLDGYMKKSKYYNKSFIEKVRNQVAQTKKIFLENISEGQSLMSQDFKVHVSMEEHMFALRRIFEDIYCSKVTT
jgi:hypothetical protein